MRSSDIIDYNGKACITIAHSRIIYILNTGNIIRLQSQDILYRSLYINYVVKKKYVGYVGGVNTTQTSYNYI